MLCKNIARVCVCVCVCVRVWQNRKWACVWICTPWCSEILDRLLTLPPHHHLTHTHTRKYLNSTWSRLSAFLSTYHTHCHDNFSSPVWEVKFKFKSSYAEIIPWCFKNYSGPQKHAFINVICTKFTFCSHFYRISYVSCSAWAHFSVNLENTAATFISPAFCFTVSLKLHLFEIHLASGCKVNQETLM